jgi:PPK2 family polyphosphate:nucleotide phosphotransferase
MGRHIVQGDLPVLDPKVLDRFRVDPDSKFRLKDHDPDWTDHDELKALRKDKMKERAQEILQANLKDLSEAQDMLYAEDRHAVLVILQAMDAAGKDGVIKHVMTGLNPQGCQVHAFKAPSAEELDHDFLWRCAVRLPERGRIGIFNRSYYEEVLVVRVHPELLDAQKLPQGKRGKSFWEDRYDDINHFEQHLARNGTVILKFFLNVSKEEQKNRFLERLQNPEKNWKFSLSDLKERQSWDDYMDAYQEALSATSKKWAPWYVIPADHKWVARVLVAEVLHLSMRSLGLRYPEVDEAKKKLLEDAHQRLESE